MQALISAGNEFMLWGALIMVVAFAIWAEERTRWGSKISGTMLVIIIGALLSNVGIIPEKSDVYGHVMGTLVPLAIPLLLIDADIRHILRESGPTLIAFMVGAVGSVLGAFTAMFFVDLPGPEAELIATLAASYIGGSMNFVAVSTATGIAGDPMLIPTLAADNLVAVIYLIFLTWLPATMAIRHIFKDHMGEKYDDASARPERVSIWESIQPLDAIRGLAIAWIIVLIGQSVQNYTGIPSAAIITITAISVIGATLFGDSLRRQQGVFQLGMLIMYLFFAVIGASANVWVLLETAPVLIVFLLILTFVHFLVVFSVGRWMKLNLPEIITGSNACILGPTTAAGLAASKGWKGLVTPAILVGVLGYAMANFVGMAIFTAVG